MYNTLVIPLIFLNVKKLTSVHIVVDVSYMHGHDPVVVDLPNHQYIIKAENTT